MDTVTSIPRGPEDLSGEWLSHVLGGHGHRVEMTALTVESIGTGQVGATFRVTPTYAHRPVGLPDTFVVKLPAADESVRNSVTFGYRSECAFYSAVNELVAVPAPECYHVDVSADASDFVLVLADQVGAAQGDQLAGCQLDAAVLAVRALAGLHAPTWNDPVWRDFDGLAFNLRDDAAKRGLGDFAKMSVDPALAVVGAELAPEDHETLAATMNAVTDWLLSEPAPFTLLHGDFRLDNLLFHQDGKSLAVVDWQTLGLGLPTRDLAYFIGTSVEIGVRRTVERRLVDSYHDELLAGGVTDYSRSQCWEHYRLGMIQSLLIPCIAVATATATDRGSEMFVTMIRRGCAAIRDLETLALVGAPTHPEE
ncbi:aminoglycoside phosphotransferase family protein [Gordonia sp. LSe1-13]|uniref:Aminoglycoside phosphotransferase family protein n=1 Tax=Gordonia sesuvii TaxID=3116777 RepID=A0ABU7MAL9_9ACTN|nr:aminoglycoside phosphotransferase family protein [Gordonia sp. LSe1-13]